MIRSGAQLSSFDLRKHCAFAGLMRPSQHKMIYREPPRRLEPSGGVTDCVGVDVAEVTLACVKPTKKYPQGRTGTWAGYQAHKGVAEVRCDACREAARLEASKDPERRKQYRRAHYAANKDLYSERNLRSKHGITAAQYDVLLAGQEGVCAICGTSEPRGRGRFHVDHDHSCCPGKKSCGKCIRGLLCGNCNPGLGAFSDNPDLLIAAAAYLVANQRRDP